MNQRELKCKKIAIRLLCLQKKMDETTTLDSTDGSGDEGKIRNDLLTKEELILKFSDNPANYIVFAAMLIGKY